MKSKALLFSLLLCTASLATQAQLSSPMGDSGVPMGTGPVCTAPTARSLPCKSAPMYCPGRC